MATEEVYPGGARRSADGFDDLGMEFDETEFAALATPVKAGTDFEPDFVDYVEPQEPSALVKRYLFPTEKFRGEWRRHWIHLVRKLGIGVAATFALGYLSGYFARQNVPAGLTVLVVVWLGIMGWVLFDVGEWYFDRFILTNKRVMLVTGIIARKVAMLPLGKVTDMKYTQTPMGRVLGYGTFEIESAGQDQALRRVKNLPNPTNVYLQVVEEMYEPDAAEARRKSAKSDDD